MWGADDCPPVAISIPVAPIRAARSSAAPNDALARSWPEFHVTSALVVRRSVIDRQRDARIVPCQPERGPSRDRRTNTPSRRPRQGVEVVRVVAAATKGCAVQDDGAVAGADLEEVAGAIGPGSRAGVTPVAAEAVVVTS
jgi:hypothetical protein